MKAGADRGACRDGWIVAVQSVIRDTHEWMMR
jgi:hypothetical protein